MAGEVKVGLPHSSPQSFGGALHQDIVFKNDSRPGQGVLPFPKVHVPVPCQPDFDPTPGGWGKK